MFLFRLLMPLLAVLLCWGSLTSADLTFFVPCEIRANMAGTYTHFYQVTGLGAAGTTWNAKGNPGLQINNAVMIKGIESGRCFNVDEANEKEDYPLNIFACFPGAANERYYLVAAGDLRFYIVCAHSGKCLGSKGDIDPAENNIVQTTCKVKDRHQMWWLEESSNGSGEFYIHHESSKMLMSVEKNGMNDGAKIILFGSFTGAKNQLYGISM